MARFVVCSKKLVSNASVIQKFALESNCKVILALKAFSSYWTFDLIRDYFHGTTASSLNEVGLGSREFSKEVHYYSPGYSVSELSEILSHCSHFTFNSLGALERDGSEVSKQAQVGLRVNPECSVVETGLYDPSSPGCRLGVTASHLPSNLPDFVSGLHCHNLCEGSAEDLDRTLQAIAKNFGGYLKNMSWLNLGGGHLITDASYDNDAALKSIQSFKSDYPNLEIILEPGAACAWQAGTLVAEILDIVPTSELPVVMLDVSFSAHMPDCLEMPYYPKITGALKSSSGYMLGGSTCLAGDILGPYQFDSEPKIGNEVEFQDMAHYTIVKTTMFNGVQHPSLWLRDPSGKEQLIKAFGYDDYRRRV